MERTDEEILSTLVHEQAHLWQCHFGTPSRAGYHNREWANKMEALGLMPSDTGAAGGKRTGQRMTHYIILGGRFDTATRELLDSGFKLNWESNKRAALANGISKLKFTCPACKQNAWAKPGARLLCGRCAVAMVAAAKG